MAYVIFDTETTGLHPEHNDRILEIAAVRVHNGHITDEIFHSLINPKRAIQAEAGHINKITPAMLEKAPSAETVIPAFLKFVGEDTLVAHHAAFDQGFLRAEMKRIGLDHSKLPPFICTQELAKKRNPELGSFISLDQLMKKFNIHADRRHRALDDVKATAEVFLRIHEEEPTLF